QSDLGLILGIMVDTSGSQRFVLEEEREASLQFLRSVVREDRDKAFVLHFDGEVELLQDITSSRRKLEAALNREELGSRRPIRRRQGAWGGQNGPGGGNPGGWGSSGGGAVGPGGRVPVIGPGAAGTALYDAILLASDELLRKQTGRKAQIL